ncbi:helix-turn-helix domain-containing protein [Streptomyces hesseae]|uniref:Helix-turn-helix transcriptional regulator n=1 Tax=Streptomyces hesseae TaxID=3075519 RepID=A0ABU2SP28_9ACTN|nr:helix-turn-helix transcriptional regulator [Streptomyces sp. DSM 40473]MDT0450640.1 helix-turn-helix transcriptional regulator [Streptomyces sp. DSM 40473]
MPAPKELDPSSSLPALYGTKLRKLRVRAGWTQKELAEKVFLSHSRIAQFELAKETPAEEVSAMLDALLGADGDLHDLWAHLQRLPPSDAFRKYKEYEAKATAIHQYQAHCVPGLLQTEAYAREVMIHALPWASEEEIDEWVAVRMARSGVLRKEAPPLLWVVLDEAVIRRLVGGPSVMRAQMAHLLKMSKEPRIEIQVLPYAAGSHAAMGGSLTVLSFDNAPDFVYLEGGTALTDMVRDRKAVARHSHRYDLVHALALPPAESRRWIEKAMEEFSTWDSN